MARLREIYDTTILPELMTQFGYRNRFEVPRLEISSTDLRDRVVDGRPLDYLVPAPVVSGIERLGLYRDDR